MKKKCTLYLLLLLAMVCLPSNTHGQDINRGPYLQQGGPNSIIVKWRTSDLENSSVAYGLTTENLSLTANDDYVTRNHEVQISGLDANTKYYYRVGSQTFLYEPKNNQESQFFNTAPNFGEDKAFRTWILGDPGTQDFRQRQVRDGFLNFSNSTSPDLMLLLGDNAYSYGTDEEYQAALFENMYEDILINTHLWSSTGNHDILYGNEDIFYGIFSQPTNGELGGTPSNTEGYYSFNYSNVHFVTIETSDEDMSANGNMANWLADDLSNNTQDWIIVYFHHPMYSGGHDSDEENDLIELRENFAPILEQYGADLVLYGHSHRYERTGLIKGHFGLSNTWDPSTMAIDDGLGQEDNGGVYDKTLSPYGTVYVTTGNAGKGLGDDGAKPVHKVTYGEIGSGVLDIDGERLDYKQLDGDGNVIDYFTIIGGATITDPDPDPTTTISVSINDSDDDVEESDNGSINYNSSDLELAYDYYNLQVIGLRFKTIELPQNAIINSAYIQFTANESNNVDSELEIALHDSSNSPAFSSSNNVSDRITFAYKETWNPSEWSSDQNTDAQKTPDLKNMVQSLVNKSDWASGNDVSFIIRGTGISSTDNDAKRVAHSYDGNPNKAAKLIIDYTEQTLSTEPIDNNNGFAIKINPNPTRSNTGIKVSVTNGNAKNLTYDIMDMKGSIVKKGKLRDNALIRLKGLQSGVYLINVKNRESESITKRFIIE